MVYYVRVCIQGISYINDVNYAFLMHMHGIYGCMFSSMLSLFATWKRFPSITLHNWHLRRGESLSTSSFIRYIKISNVFGTQLLAHMMCCRSGDGREKINSPKGKMLICDPITLNGMANDVSNKIQLNISLWQNHLFVFLIAHNITISARHKF